MDSKVDILFLHTPKFGNYYPPLGYFTSINQMPAGLMGLAEVARSQGRRVQVLHLGIERVLDQGFSLAGFLAEARPALVGVSLHFHPQSADAVKAWRVVGRVLPDAFLVVGGFQASFFAREILEGHPEVDAVVRGDGERAIGHLARLLPRPGDELGGVPNLAWRRGGEVRENPVLPFHESADLAEVRRDNLDLLRNSATYLQVAQFLWYYSVRSSLEANLRLYGHVNGYPLPFVRGCPFNCIYCGGGSQAQSFVTGRRHAVALPLARVLEEVWNLEGRGVSAFFVEYVPLDDGDGYYLDLFAGLRREGRAPGGLAENPPVAGTGLFRPRFETRSLICSPANSTSCSSRGRKIPPPGSVRVSGQAPSLNVECRSLPSVEFLEAFAATFGGDPKSRVTLSPDTMSETLRAQVRLGGSYTNRELRERLDLMEALGIGFELFFCAGLPGEELEHVRELAESIGEMRRTYRFLRATRVHSIELDPASPMYRNPDAFGLADTLRSFDDYVRYHGNPRTSTLQSVGYGLQGSDGGLSQDENGERIARLVCDNFCRVAQPLDRWVGRPCQGVLGRLIRRVCNLKRRLDRPPYPQDLFPY